MRTLTAYVEWDPETKLYVGTVPGIPGAHTQVETRDELNQNLHEVLELCLEESKTPDDLPVFVGPRKSKLPYDSHTLCRFQDDGEGAPSTWFSTSAAKRQPYLLQSPGWPVDYTAEPRR